MKLQDLKGMIFGEWTVLERDVEKSKEKNIFLIFPINNYNCINAV